MRVVSVLKPKLGTSRRLMCCYCLQLSSEHFYLQKMTELALFIMYFCSWAWFHTPLCCLLFPFFFFFLFLEIIAFRGKCEFACKIFICWMQMVGWECYFVWKCMFSQDSFLFFVSHSWLLSKIWQSNWHFVSQTWRILIAPDCIKLYRLTNEEARVWAPAFWVFCLRRPSSWQAMSVWNYWNRRFKAFWTHSQDERAVKELTCSQLTCTFKYD